MVKDTMSNLLEGQVCFGEGSTPVKHRCFKEACFPRRHSAGIGPIALLGHSPQSPALDRPSSLLGRAASAEGPDTAPRRRGNGEIPFLWSEHRPAKNKTFATE